MPLVPFRRRSARVRAVLERGDAGALDALLRADRRASEALIRCGPPWSRGVPPIHYVCDLVFAGRLAGPAGAALADVLIAHGADVDRTDRAGSLLVNAASLGAEEVALRLVRAGAVVGVTSGLHGATALHWAALLGLGPLTEALLAAGADPHRRDATYGADPLGWAVEGATEGAAGSRGDYVTVARRLVEAGAADPHVHCGRLQAAEHAALRRVLCGAPGPNDDAD